jgi:cytochrome c biogenesis protein CcmG, thiol:disulfide interchange protein DsbE
VSNRPTKKPLASQRVKQAQVAADGRRTWWIVGGVAVVVGVALVIAVLVGRGSGGPEGGSASPSGGTVVPSGDRSFGEPSTSGTPPLPVLPDGGAGNPAADPAVGTVAATVSGQTFDGSAVSITNDATPKVLLFLAHWCPNCQREVPSVQDWLDENGMPSDVAVVSVATGTSADRSNYPPGDWLRSEGWSVPTIVDDADGTVGRAYGVSGFPFFVVLDADGKVVVRASGELDEAGWEQLLEAARTGTFTGPLGAGPASGAG